MDGVDGREDHRADLARRFIEQMRNYALAREYPTVHLPSLRKLFTEYKRQADKDYDDYKPMGDPIRPYDVPYDPEFTYRLEKEQWDPKTPTQKSAFALPSSDQHYYRPGSGSRTVKPGQYPNSAMYLMAAFFVLFGVWV